MIRYPSNRSQITVATNVTKYNNSGGNNDTSVITYDHLGNPLRLENSELKHLIKKVSVAWKHYGRILQLDLFHINIGSRRFIEKSSRKQEKINWDACSTCMNNHTDKNKIGRNIHTIEFTSAECTVTHFLAEYSEQVNIPICKGATSCTMEYGEVIILIIWLVNRM